MPLSNESNNVSLNPLIKHILLFYLQKKKFKQNILDVFHQHFELTPYSGKSRVRRSLFFKMMRDNLRLGFGHKSPELYFLKDILLQNNVRVVKIQGIKYYKGLGVRTP